MPNTSSPASGERRAAGGLHAQYRAAAVLALQALRAGDLVEIRLTDPEAGRVDDVQVVREHRVDAYQVKWSRFPGTLTLHALTTSGDDGPSLVAQLADGWQRLARTHPDRRTAVHLLTNDVPSSSTRVATGAGAPSPSHLAAFLAEAWEPVRAGEPLDADGPWAEPWQALQSASGLARGDFAAFLPDCVLDLAAPALPDDADHRALAELFFETAGAVRHEVSLSRRTILERLGWTRRFAPLNRHEFDVPRFYRPVARTADAVRERLAALPGGYLAVVGPPGSGKSTLLTRTLRGVRLGGHPVRLVRYYAFVRETQGPAALRGESAHFLHDVTLRLQDAGICRSAPRPDPGDRAALLALFHDQLVAVGEDAALTGRRTVLLVDGLDHIDREQHPERSLLHDLPLPRQVPDGVYVVLGSQRTDIEALPLAIQRAAADTTRRVEMAPLTPGDVSAVADEVVPGLTAAQRGRVSELSGGHPLALVYLLRRLGAAPSESRDAVLDEAVPYADDIDADYDAHWQRIAHDDALVHTLALLARIRGPIDLAWASGWMGMPTARLLERVFGPYFDQDGAGRWTFFHNSFRLFLQASTARPPFGGPAADRVRTLHRELAQHFAPDHPDALYHLVEAGDDAAAVALATTDWLLGQARALRPLTAIQADVRLAIRAAGRTDDALALVRLLLLAADLDQRAHILDEDATVAHLMDLGDAAAAAEAARDGDRLRISPPAALHLSPRLADAGLVRDGARLFELAAPYDTLAGTPLPEVGGPEPWKVLRAWADAAPRFLDPTDAVERVRTVQVEPHPHHSPGDGDATAHLHAELIGRLAAAAARRGAWADWWRYLRALRQGGADALRLLSDSAHAAQDPDDARRLVAVVARHYGPAPAGSGLRTVAEDAAFAALALRSDPDVARTWSATLLPLPIRDAASRLHGPSRAAVRLRLYRLRYALGETAEPRTLVAADAAATDWPDRHEDDRDGARRLALAVATIGAAWGRADAGDRLAPSVFLREVGWTLGAFNAHEVRPHLLLHEAGTSTAELMGWAAAAAVAHGPNVAEALVERLGARWDEGLGSADEVRAVARALAQAGTADLARRLLARAAADPNPDPWARVGACREAMQVSLALGDADAARRSLAETVDAARGTLDKHDHQLGVWVDWMDRANTADPAGAEARVRLMLRRLVVVEPGTGGVDDAACALILAAARWSPRRAVPVLHGLLERGVVDHNAGLAALLCGVLERPNPPADAALHAVAQLMIPFGGPDADALCQSLLAAVHAVHGADGTRRAARYLTDRVRAEALRRDRPAWLRGIAQAVEALGLSASEVGIRPDDVASPSANGDDPRLALTDGRHLTLAGALAEIASAPDFARLAALHDADASRFYRWGELAERAAERARPDEIEALARSVEATLNAREASVALAGLSGRARAVGRVPLADRLAQRAFDLSDPAGWDPAFDGGSRLAAVEALRASDVEAARRVAVAGLAHDLGSGRPGLSPHRLVHHAGRLLPLLFDTLPVLDVWAVVEDYLDRLFTALPAPRVPEAEDGLDALSPVPPDDTPGRALAEAVALYLDFPAYPVAARAVAAAAATLVACPTNAATIAALHEAASRSEDAAEGVLTAFAAAVATSPAVGEAVSQVLDAFETHPHLFLRSRAAFVRSRAGGRPLAFPFADRPLPAIYSLELPPHVARRDAPAVVLDPARRLRPLDLDVRGLALAADVDEAAALAHAARLAEASAPDRGWLRGPDLPSSERLQQFLRSAQVQVSHRKPHVASAARAVGHVAGDLYDAGLLPIPAAAFFARWTTGDDPDLVLRAPDARPTWLSGMGGMDADTEIWSVPGGWLGDAAQSLGRLRAHSSDGRVVLAERARFAYLGTDDRMEEIRSAACHSRPAATGPAGDALDADPDESWTPFHRVEALRIADYLGQEAQDGALILHAPSRRALTPGTGWIAVDPALARRLGWRPDATGLFRWRDESGSIMVETVWWTDGLLDRHDGRTRDVVGEGWLVLAAPAAVETLRRLHPGTGRWGTATRRLGPFGSRGHETAAARLDGA